MANTKSAEKQARVSIRRRAINQSIESSVKSSVKKIRALSNEGKKEEAVKLYPEFQSQIDRAAKKGVFHRNTADRYKKRIASMLKKNAK